MIISNTLATAPAARLSILAGALLLAACSDSGTVTTLDARPNVSIALPQALLSSSVVVTDNLRPEIRFAGGASVSLQKGAGTDWSGTINLAPGRTYQTTLTWYERVDGRDIPLTRLSQTLDVAADGTITRTDTGSYDTEIDSDSDGVSNLQERENGTDPFQSDNGATTGTGDGNGTDAGGGDEGGNTDTGGDTGTGTGTGTDGGSDDGTGTDGGVDTGTDTGIDTTGGDDGDDGTTAGDDAGTDDAGDDGGATGAGGDDGDDGDGADTGGDDAGTDDGGSDGSDEGGDDDGDDGDDGDDDDTDDTPTTPPPAVADVIVPRIASADAPVIDGEGLEALGSNGELIGEWAAAVQNDNSGAPLLINQLILDDGTDEEAGSERRRWAAMHDGDFLYVLVLVDDDGDRNRDSGIDIAQDDSLELFIDGDNSKSSRYDSNDFHRILPVQLAGRDKQPASSGAVVGPESSSASLTMSFTTGPGIGPDGIVRRQYEQDVYEVRIGIASAGIDPDQPFGFELHVNDDDGGDERNARWAWKLPTGSADVADENPSVFGTLVLE